MQNEKTYKMKNLKTQLSATELELVVSSLSMTISAIETAEQKEVYLELYNKLTK